MEIDYSSTTGNYVIPTKEEKWEPILVTLTTKPGGLGDVEPSRYLISSDSMSLDPAVAQ